MNALPSLRERLELEHTTVGLQREKQMAAFEHVRTHECPLFDDLVVQRALGTLRIGHRTELHL
jgi:hypothetical protein